MGLRPLGIAKEIVESLRLEITYHYDDLIFVEHNAFILQFDDASDTNLKVFFNTDLESEKRTEIEAKLTVSARDREFTITVCGLYEMTNEKGSKELKINFIPASV